jgi:glucose/arabinose dehydrogenase
VLAGAAAPQADALTAQPLNGTFSSPVQVVFPPGDARLFVVQRGGAIGIYENGAINATSFLDLNDPVTKVVSSGGEQGLLSMAFAPDYATSGYFFVAYTGVANAGASPPNGAGALVVSRFKVSANPDVADPTEQRLLVVEHPGQTNHNAGQLQFGPDGDLYISTGDGGGGGDPGGNAQSLNTRLGKVLRIDPLGNTTTAPFYNVPSDNPFVGGTNTVDDLIWSYGLRNPWRYSFDRSTGDLVIADVGQGLREEIDFIPRTAGGGAGVNFGWNCREGLIAYTNPGTSCATTTNFTDPVFDYPHTDPTPANPTDNAFGCAVIGGYVYRGTAIPGLAGRYLYTDNCNGDLRSQLLCQPSSVDDRSEGVAISGPSGFGQDSTGELYVASLGDGKVYELTGGATSSAAACPAPSASQLPASIPPGAVSGFDLKAAIRRCKKHHRGKIRRRCIRRAKRRASAS